MAKKIINEATKLTGETIDGIEKIVGSAQVEFDRRVRPVRENIFQRFPILFALSVTFGLTATLTGMEQLLLRYDLLQEHPFVILLLGIGTLVATGTLYKKLG